MFRDGFQSRLQVPLSPSPPKTQSQGLKPGFYSGSYLDEDQPLHWIESTRVLNESICPEGKPWMEEGKNWPGWVFYPSFYAFASKKDKQNVMVDVRNCSKFIFSCVTI